MHNKGRDLLIDSGVVVHHGDRSATEQQVQAELVFWELAVTDFLHLFLWKSMFV